MGCVCQGMDRIYKEKMKHLICSDIDGTLLNIDRVLSEKTIQLFKKLKDKYPIVLISSRMPKSMRLLQNELEITNHPLIAYNGNLIIDNDTILYSESLSTDISYAVSNYVKGTTIHLSLYHNDNWNVPQDDFWAKREMNNTRVKPKIQPIEQTLDQWQSKQWGAHKIMCMGEENEIDVLYKKLLSNHANELHAYRSKSTYIEISPIAKDKASAILFLIQNKYPELSMENVISFGDNYNDATLLQQSGIGVAVANAKPEILKLASNITSTNINDGVALFLNEMENNGQL